MATSITASEDGLFQLSVGSDRDYTAVSFAQWLKYVSSNGVLTQGEVLSDELECTPDSGTMDTDVAAGVAAVEGHMMLFLSGGTVTHPTADVTNPRIDTIVLEKNTDSGTRSDTIKLVEGTPAGSPSPTALTQTSDVWQEYLYYVTVPANETDADNFTYTDQRETSKALFDILDNSITLAKMTDDSVDTDELVDDAVTIDKIDADASTTAKGVVELATQAEVDTGTDTARVVTPATLAGNELPYCKLKRVAAQTSGADISWDTEDYDTDSFWAIGSPTNIVIPSTGYYQVDVIMNFDFSVDGLGYIFMYLDGVNQASLIYEFITSVTDNYGKCMSMVLYATAADIILIKNSSAFSGTKSLAGAFITVKKLR